MRNAARAMAVLFLAAGLSGMHFEDRAAAASKPKCFGAASRDPLKPCLNHMLSFMATPTAHSAEAQASAPCTQVRFKMPGICAFGVSPKKADKTVALIGDSHAIHWRAALAVLARRGDWHGLTFSKSTCAFTFAKRPPQSNCDDWPQSVVRWLNTHPYVHTVFVSAQTQTHVVATPGLSGKATKIDGFLRTWKALAPSVTKIIVLRDTPDFPPNSTQRCIRKELAKHHNAGVRCARPRHAAVATDYQALAAEQAASPRVSVIDLTSFVCDAEKCFPVVGGVLVNHDRGHMTRAFSATLGPYLGRAIRQLGGIG